ncbi:MAG TPA: FAD-dependent oxidoreductase [Sedimentisphaerales bacterium]|nr:FAD-dependent oxidoreductase [Sedimentisphaerales bacterium]
MKSMSSSSGAVSAAVAAAENGARVFLAAPRPYLGEDLCATYRLWLEPDEEPTSPLAAAVFAEPEAPAVLANQIPFTYQADVESAAQHKDSAQSTGRRDGKWHSAPSQSVQYNSDGTLTVDLGGEQFVGKAYLMAYQRNDEFEVADVAFFVGDDKEHWRPVATTVNNQLGQGFEQMAIPLSAAVDQKARYLKLAVRKTPQARRILLGEIILEGPRQDVVKQASRMAPTPMQVKRVLDDALLHAGVQFLYGCYPTELLVDHKGNVAGIVMANRSGRQAVVARVIIDATPHATVAQMAGTRYTNTDYTFIDNLDVINAWQSFLAARKKFADRYDLGQIIDTRERRQIVGDFFMTPMDVYLDRTLPDSVVRASSNFDTHGFTIHPMFLLRPPDRKTLPCYIPYRCLLPKGIEGVLVTGLGVSAHRDVMPVIRMQPDVQNQGYAAGVAAATAARTGQTLREIDVHRLQEHLVRKGNLPAEVLKQKDSFPLPKARIEQAVRSVVKDFNDIEVIFTQIDTALPLLREAYKAAESKEDKLTHAHILGILGDPSGAETLAEAVAARQWDKGWKYTGMGQYGMSMSVVDSLIVALGRTRKDVALEPILAKVAQLGPEHELSHHRAVALALETLGNRAGAKPLADLLSKPGMTGYPWTDINAAITGIPASSVDTSTRECSLRELILARALYRGGDHNGLGEKTLRQYAQDLRGHYARHALAVLDEKR